MFFHQHLLSRWEMFRECFFHGNSWYHPKKKQNKLLKYKIIIVSLLINNKNVTSDLNSTIKQTKRKLNQNTKTKREIHYNIQMQVDILVVRKFLLVARLLVQQQIMERSIILPTIRVPN